MHGEVSIGDSHYCTKISSLHPAPHNHYIGRPEPYVLHSDSLGAQVQVLPMDSHTIGV